MKKTEVLEILDYMFEFLFANTQPGSTTEIDDITIKNYLSDAGFEQTNIDKALKYLNDMTGTDIKLEEIKTKQKSNGMRIYNKSEQEKLGIKGCGLLFYLEHSKKLSASSRELIIEQIYDLPYECSFEELLWIAQSININANHKDIAGIANEIDYDNDKFSIRH